MTLLLTVFFGWTGYYRFHKKQYALGILYLLTFGVFGIGWIVDIVAAAKEPQGAPSKAGAEQNEVEEKSLESRTIFDPFISGENNFSITETSIIVGQTELPYEQCSKINVISGAISLVGKGGYATFTAAGREYGIYFKYADNVRFCRALEYANKKIFECQNEPVPKYYFIGYTGSELAVYDKYITLSHVRFTSGVVDFVFKQMEGGNNGVKRIRIADITSIQHKEATRSVVGFVQFSYAGSVEARGTSGSAVNDENSVPYYLERISEMKEIVDFLENARENASHPQNGTTVVTQTLSAADELKKYKSLLDEGIITQEEFDEKRKQLLK